METQEVKKKSMMTYAATYGLMIGVVLILLTTLDYVFKLYGNSPLNLLSYVVMAVAVVFFTIQYRNKALGGYISYGEALGFGILLIIFACLLNGIFTAILHVADPAYWQKQLDMVADSMMQGGAKDEQIEMMLKMTKMMHNPIITVVGSIFGGAIVGTVISLVSSIFTKKQKSIFE